MLEKLKAFGKWLWNWVTVVVGILMGVLTIGMNYLDQLMGIDLTQVMSHERAMQITFGVAVTKAIVTAYNARKQA